MRSKPENPAQRIATLQAGMVRTLEDQRAFEMQQSEAINAEARALHLLDQSRAVQSRCKTKIEECIDGIRSMEDEIAQLPKQRRGL